MKISWFEIKNKDVIAALILIGVVLIAPHIISDRFYLNLMFLVFLFAGLSSAWNLLGGYAGQFSLGHTAFFGIGAYTSTLFYNFAGLTPWIGMLAGVGISMTLAFLISYSVFRLRGVFFAMATVAMGETVRVLLLWGRSKADIPYGLSIDYKPAFINMIFSEPRSYAMLAGLFMLLVTLVCYLLTNSRVGYYLRALRDNEDAAQSVGIDLRRYKLIAFLISAGFTSIGGTLMAQYVLYIEPSSVFNMTISIDLALMTIMGGIGTILGPLIGALITIPLQEFLKDWLGSFGAGAHLVVYAAILILIVMLLPEGVVGAWRNFRTKSKKGDSRA
jgi:branched-chain amino acid transport system permease protein